MKRLEKFLRPYRRESILAPLFKLLEVVFDLMVPVVIAQIIDVGVAKNDHGYIVEMFFVLLLMAAVGLLCSFTAQFFAAKASVGFATSVRQAMFDHIQGLSFTELDTLGTDTLITRLTDDVNQVQNGINMGLRLLLRSPFVVIGAMVMAFTINVRCALIFVVTVPILFVVVFSIMLISIPLFKKVQAGLDCVTGLTRENLTGIRVIRAFCREEQSVEEFEEGNRELTRLNEFVGRISALLNPLTYVLINGATVLLIAHAGVQVNIGNLQQGQVVALYNYMAQIIVELIKLASLIITLNKSMACADRVSGILDVKSSMEYKVAAEQMKNEQINADQRKYETDGENDQADSNLAVEFNHVTFTYEGAGASSLSDITFRAKKGQTIGIIGGTGSGKSTLVSLIPRFYDPQEGTVKVNGINAKDYPQGELCSEIGVVQQRSILFKGSIRDNLKWGNDQASDEDLWKAITIAQAKDVVEAKPGKLDFEVEQNGRNLSGGQKQRLTIARALVSKPEILILDDSLSALDFATDAALRQAIGELEGNVTTFLVSQRISGIRQADKILVMEDGELAGQGTHEELMETCETYQEIYYSQFPEERPAAVKSSKETGKDLDKADKMTEKEEKGAAE